MIEEISGYEGQVSTKLEQCKRDYEREIKNQKDKLEKTVALKNALLGYAGPAGRIRGGSAELLGELVCEERAIEYTIERLIEQQEKEAGG